MNEPWEPLPSGLTQVSQSPASPKELIDLTLFQITQWLYPLLIKQKNLNLLETVRDSLPSIITRLSVYPELQTPIFKEFFIFVCNFLNSQALKDFIAEPTEGNIPEDFSQKMLYFSYVIGHIHTFLEEKNHLWQNLSRVGDSINGAFSSNPEVEKVEKFLQKRGQELTWPKLKEDYQSLRLMYLVLKDELLSASGLKLSGSQSLNRGERVW